jgi:ATP-binding cassette subfamily B multidrug efflux pump
LTPLSFVSQKYSIVQSAMASAERIFQLLDTRGTLPSAGAQDKQPAIRGAVAFRQVRFGYEAQQPILHDLSFQIEPGQTLAIVGSGKSTIVNLLERFYDPDSGSILIDGRDVRSLNTRWLRQQIGLVMQDGFIVPGSIRDNVLLDREMDDEGLSRIIDRAQLSTLVRRLPEGLATIIGEGGIDLSAGQKQLLAFARVLARDPRILVLDEATSSVDSETEMLIDRAIDSSLANRISIVITHRLSTIKRAGHILVMEQGRIAEEGSHDSLMAREGIYRRLQDLQIIGQAGNGVRNNLP